MTPNIYEIKFEQPFLQPNGYDCGLYCIAVVETLTSTTYNIEEQLTREEMKRRLSAIIKTKENVILYPDYGDPLRIAGGVLSDNQQVSNEYITPTNNVTAVHSVEHLSAFDQRATPHPTHEIPKQPSFFNMLPALLPCRNFGSTFPYPISNPYRKKRTS